MPKVQTYDVPTVQEHPVRVPLQNLNSEGSWGEPIARGAQSFVNNAERVMQQNDEAVVKEQLNLYREKSRQVLFGDENAFLNRKGRAAFDSREAVQKELDDYRKALGKNMTGSQQRYWEITSGEMMNRDLDAIARHSATARTDWLNEQDEMTAQQAAMDGMAYWNTPPINPNESHNRAVASDARYGELGIIDRPDGSHSTELSITVEDEELGGWVNIPLLVKGQSNVEALTSGAKATPEQQAIAVRRARERVKGGAALPAYASLEDAEAQAVARDEWTKNKPYRAKNPYELQIEQSVANLGKRNGWTPERISIEEQKQVTAMHVGAIESILDQKPAEAQAYYNLYKDSITPAARPKIEKAIEDTTMDVRHQATTDALFARFGTDSKAGLEYIHANYEGEEEDKLVTRYKTRVAENEENVRVSTNAAIRGAVDTVWGGGGIEAIDPVTKKQLQDAGKWDAIVNEEIARRTGVRQHNDPVWLSDNYLSKSVDEQAQVPVDELKAHTNYETFTSIMEDREKAQEPFIPQSDDALIKLRLEEAGVKTGAKAKDEDKRRWSAFWETYRKEIDIFQSDKKRAPSPLERQNIINQIAAASDLVVDKGVFNDSLATGAAFEVVTPANIVELEDELEIPREDIRLAMDYMISKGIPLTKANLLLVYEKGAAP